MSELNKSAKEMSASSEKTSAQEKELANSEMLGADLAKPSKMPRLNDFPNHEECVIIKKPRQLIKVEVVDLTDDSNRIIPTMCFPVRTSFLKNTDKADATPCVNGDAVRVKTEPIENTSAINAYVGVATGMDNQAATTNSVDVPIKMELVENCSTNNKSKGVNGDAVRVKTEPIENTSAINAYAGVATGMDNQAATTYSVDVPIKMELVENCSTKNKSSSNSDISPDVNSTGLNSLHNPDVGEQRNANDRKTENIKHGSFPTELLKYLNCNRKCDLKEIARVLIVLDVLLNDVESTNEIKLDEMDNSCDSRVEPKLSSVEISKMKRKHFTDQPPNKDFKKSRKFLLPTPTEKLALLRELNKYL